MRIFSSPFVLILYLSVIFVTEAFAPLQVNPTHRNNESRSAVGSAIWRGFNRAKTPSAQCNSIHRKNTKLSLSGNDKSSGTNTEGSSQLPEALRRITSDPATCAMFSIAMASCGAALGPFLDSYHSAFGVLQYDAPISFALWESADHPALTTSWWVPELFGLAGFIIGWLYIILDAILTGTNFITRKQKLNPSPPLILTGIAFFTFQYWLSGSLYGSGYDRSTILAVMTTLCFLGFVVFDGSVAGLIASLATAVGGPLIEVGLITHLAGSGYGYHYTDVGETGFFPLWIVPVYFLGGPANGNLARGIWNALSAETSTATSKNQAFPRCNVCNDTRAVACPNCDAEGSYVTYGRRVRCNCCRGRGLVICRSCFNDYGDDPNDIENVRNIMSRIPD